MTNRKNVPRITLYGLQFKSLAKLQLLAKHLDAIEVEFGIHSCEVKIEDCFICPWIGADESDKLNVTPMEKVVRRVIEGQRKAERKITARKKLGR